VQPVSPPRQVSADLLPRWEHLPPERKRELIMTLTTILVKRLAGLHDPPEEASRE